MHGVDVHFDDLVWLCLGLATEIDNLKKKIEENKTYNQPLPIETIPKNKPVLIFNKGQWIIGQLHDDEIMGSCLLSCCASSILDATHWIPLPKIPKDKHDK